LPLEEYLSLAAMHRILEKASVERISDSACVELAKTLEKIGVEICKDSLEFAMHAGRKTVKGKDVKVAAKKVFER
jgi:histone H3/H4